MTGRCFWKGICRFYLLLWEIGGKEGKRSVWQRVCGVDKISQQNIIVIWFEKQVKYK